MSDVVRIPDTDFVVRKATEADRSFILSSWLRSHRKSDYARSVGMSNYHDWHPGRVEDALDTKRVTLCVCLDEEPYDVIVGWATGKPSIGLLDYMYIKSAARQTGLGSYLLKSLRAERRSHETPHTNAFFMKRKITYDPYGFR